MMGGGGPPGMDAGGAGAGEGMGGMDMNAMMQQMMGGGGGGMPGMGGGGGGTRMPPGMPRGMGKPRRR